MKTETQIARGHSPTEIGITWALLVALALHLGALNGAGQSVLNPNTIPGTLRLLNAAPLALSYLNGGPQPGMRTARIAARRNPPGTPLFAQVDISIFGASTKAFELTVESDPAGHTYEVGYSPGSGAFVSHVDFTPPSGAVRYFLRGVNSAAVLPPPATVPLVLLDECAGVLDLRFVSEGLPFPISGGSVRAYPSGTSALQVEVAALAAGISQATVFVRGGEPLDIVVQYTTGTDAESDLITYEQRFSLTIPCDGVMTHTLTQPPPTSRGQIIGRVDMVGETEIGTGTPFLAQTLIRAANGPVGNRRDTLLPAPYFGPFALTNLAPSSASTPAKDYEAFAALNIQRGSWRQYYRSPILGQGLNPGVQVVAGETTDLGDTFVFHPGYVRGRLFLQGPAEALLGHPSPLRSLVPVPGAEFNSYALADGLAAATAGGSYTAGAAARATFEGFFDGTRAFDGHYELALAGLAGRPNRWERFSAWLRLNSGAPESPDAYASHELVLMDVLNPQYNGSLEVAPGGNHVNDLKYCLSKVIVDLDTLSSRLWNPTVYTLGQLHPSQGTDFEGNVRWYQAELRSALGTPSTPSPRGQVVFYLPQGQYTLQPSAQVANPGGGSSLVNFPTIPLTVPCGECVRVGPCLRVEITNAPACAGEQATRIDGFVTTLCTNTVTRLEWSMPGGATNTICEGCGTNPGFTFVLPTDGSCTGQVFTVTAYDDAGRVASVTRTIPRDTTPPVIQFTSNDLLFPCPRQVQFPWTVTDNCDPHPTLTCIPASGSVFSVGTTPVTCVATDACGNSNLFNFWVTVFSNCELTSCSYSNLLVNGSFEEPTLPDFYWQTGPDDPLLAGWRTLGQGVEYHVNLAPGTVYPVAAQGVAHGFYAVDLASANGPGGIKQTFATVPGRSYTVTFYLGTQKDRGREGFASVTASAAEISHYFSMENATPNTFFTQFTFTFSAVADTTTLAFTTTNDPARAFVQLDDVRVSECCVALTCPTNLVVSCQSALGAEVHYPFTATNHCSPAAPYMQCDPPSGSLFPIGTNSVTCLAAGSGETKFCTFSVTVLNNCLPETQFGGLPNHPLGSATLLTLSNRLVVSGLGTQGVDGVAITLGEAEFGSVTLDEIPSSLMPTGASVALRAVGQARDALNQSLGTLRAVNRGDHIEYSLDFGGIGGVAVTALLYDQDTLVASAHDLTGTVARVSGPFRLQRWIPYLPRGDRPGAQIEFLSTDEPPGLITLADPMPTWGTRLVFVPQATSLTFPTEPWVLPPTFDPWSFLAPFWRRPPFPWPMPPWPDPGPDPWPLGAVSRLELVGSGLPQFALLKERIGKFRLAHEAVGQARISGLGEALVIEGIPPAGEHGVDLTYVPTPRGVDCDCPVEPSPPPPPPPPPPPCSEFATHCYPLQWLRLEADSWPVGSFLRSGLRGLAGGAPDQFLGALTARQSGTNAFSIESDFTGLASPRQRVEVLRSGLWVDTSFTSNGVAATVAAWPTGSGIDVPPLCPPPYVSCPPPSVSFTWPQAISIVLPDNRVVIGDEIRVVPELVSSTNAVQWTALGLRAGGGLTGLTLLGADHGPTGLFYQGLPHLPLGGATLQVESNAVVASNLGTNGSGGIMVALAASGYGVVELDNPFAGAVVAEGASVHVEAFGTLNGVPDQALGGVTATRAGPVIQFTAAHPLLGVTQTTVLVFDGPTIVGLDPSVPTPIVTVPTNLAGRLRFDPIWVMGPESVWNIVDLPGRPEITLAGQSPVRGDRIAFIPRLSDPYPQPNLPAGLAAREGNPSPQPYLYLKDIGTISRLGITGQGIHALRLRRAQVGAFHQTHEALGQARILGLGDELQVNNLVSDAANPDGVRILAGGSIGTFAAYWRPLDPFNNAPVGAMLRLGVRGLTQAGEERDLGALQITSLGLTKEVTSDFSAVGAASRLVEVLRSNVVIFSTIVAGATGAVARTPDWPDGAARAYPMPPPDPPIAALRWATGTAFDIQGQILFGDELRVGAEAPAGIGNGLASLSLQAAGLPSLRLLTTGEVSPHPLAAQIQRFGSTVVVSWTPLGPRQGLEAADNVEGPWAPVAGVTAPPYLTPAAGARQYYRVRQP